MRDKTYLLGSSEAMKYEPRLDEEYYLADDGSAGRYDSGDADSDRAGDEEYYVEYGGYKLYYTRTVLDDMDGTLAKTLQSLVCDYETPDQLKYGGTSVDEEPF